jgi:hypothetical protein
VSTEERLPDGRTDVERRVILNTIGKKYIDEVSVEVAI